MEGFLHGIIRVYSAVSSITCSSSSCGVVSLAGGHARYWPFGGSLQCHGAVLDDPQAVLVSTTVRCSVCRTTLPRPWGSPSIPSEVTTTRRARRTRRSARRPGRASRSASRIDTSSGGTSQVVAIFATPACPGAELQPRQQLASNRGPAHGSGEPAIDVDHPARSGNRDPAPDRSEIELTEERGNVLHKYRGNRHSPVFNR
jgi:hypothetical protein